MSRFLTAIVAVAVVISWWAAPAFAHAEIRERAPAAGQTVGGTVDHIDVAFLAPIESARISLVGPDGQQIDVGETEIRRNGLIISVEFEAISEPGNYTVSHFELAADGDEQRAAYGFVFDPDAEARVASLIDRDDGPNWGLLGAVGGVVLIGVLLFAPWRR